MKFEGLSSKGTRVIPEGERHNDQVFMQHELGIKYSREDDALILIAYR